LSFGVCLVGKECEVHDFIVGTETHQRAKDDKRFKQFLVQTAIEAIEKQRGLQLDPSMHLLLFITNIKCTFLCGI
jgi:dynein assembly factor 2